MTSEITLLSVNVALPRYLGQHRGRPVTSAIAKTPVTVEHLRLGRLNLEGDGQADRRVHGGPDKAVYAYPSEHLAAWSAELGQDLGPAPFGENLSTAGATEHDVCIGDRWYWGDAVLEVCQPRSPCFKLALHRRNGEIGRMLRRSDRCGFYLRVLQPGTVPVAGPVSAERHGAGVTVAAAHRALWFAEATVDDLERILAVEPLALGWRAALTERLKSL